MRYHRVPDETIKRLPIYLRRVIHLSEMGVKCVSSTELAIFLGISPWQIRKDLSYFGGFGTRGVGYNVENLVSRIREILKLNVTRKAALVGVGNLGSAILSYPGFNRYWLEIAAAFDIDKGKVGKKLNGLVVEDVAYLRTLKDRQINLGIIAVPGEAVQEVANNLVEAGIKAILNFAPRYIEVPKRVKVITIDIALYLARLPYYVPSKWMGKTY
ncbi:MAG: redox-sensing transcriptional repressor Rex [Sedimentisphaerales bacterium]|nr:redox-sensing transcriptional repressor Rex [Sedimentisphaerales bacterium]